MRYSGVVRLAVAVVLAAFTISGHGAIVQWRLSGVAFDDGTAAQGTFSYDDVADAVVAWHITVARGTVLLPFAYMPGDSVVFYYQEPTAVGPTVAFSSPEAGAPHSGGVSPRQFRITTTAPLASAGPVLPLDLNTVPDHSLGLECLDCGSVRVIVSGAIERVAFPPPVAAIEAIEFYHAGFDHYFLSADPPEIAALDSGFFTGWARTGERFLVHVPGSYDPAPVRPVCRFYGLPSAGLDSHFYSASPAECYQVNLVFGSEWQVEGGNVFQVILPDTATGACPVGTVPVYRVFNRRSDANHRYTTSQSIRAHMETLGWIREGDGPDATVMCAFAPPPA
ncbi:MAG: hypothetical protein ABI585_06745 [Betaproteobacteria bacterium]